MNQAQDEILTLLDSHFVGIIWISETNFYQDQKYFQTMDYLFDGLLSENYKNFSQQEKRLNFFSTQCFGHSFFLGHINYNDKSLGGDLKNILNLTSPLKNHQNQVFLLSEDNTICGKALQLARKNFKQFTFR
jgi:hypothetical protein